MGQSGAGAAEGPRTVAIEHAGQIFASPTAPWAGVGPYGSIPGRCAWRTPTTLASRRSRRSNLRRTDRHLPRRPLPQDRPTPRPYESPVRRRPLHPGVRLAPHERPDRPLPTPRPRLPQRQPRPGPQEPRPRPPGQGPRSRCHPPRQPPDIPRPHGPTRAPPTATVEGPAPSPSDRWVFRSDGRRGEEPITSDGLSPAANPPARSLRSCGAMWAGIGPGPGAGHAPVSVGIPLRPPGRARPPPP